MSIAAPFVGAKEPFPKVVPVTDLQSSVALKLVEHRGGFKASENDPSKAIKRIDAPVMVIGNKDGDVYISPEDTKTLANNTKYGIPVLVQSQYTTLKDRHKPEFTNPVVIADMFQFVKNCM